MYNKAIVCRNKSLLSIKLQYRFLHCTWQGIRNVAKEMFDKSRGFELGVGGKNRCNGLKVCRIKLGKKWNVLKFGLSVKRLKVED